MKIGILHNENYSLHSTSWNHPWIAYCNENKLDFELIDFNSNKLFEKINSIDILLWHYSGYLYQDMLFARSILYSAKAKGKIVFPDYNESWHFDDKVAQHFLFETLNFPKPKSWAFFNIKKLEESLSKNEISFPVVFKLRNGSGSQNVQLIPDSNKLLEMANVMFTTGKSIKPNLLFKAWSNIKSANSIEIVWKRMQRIPEFFKIRNEASKIPDELGYLYFQEFIENDGFDLKVVTVNDKIGFIVRPVRDNDFRASGGGSLTYDKDKISSKVVNIALSISNQMGFKCMGYDFVIDKKTGDPKIIEISYGFSHKAVMDGKGYYTPEFQWIPESMNAPVELLKDLIFEFEQLK